MEPPPKKTSDSSTKSPFLSVTAVVFSKDRPFQLHECLRTLTKYNVGAATEADQPRLLLRVKVLLTTHHGPPASRMDNERVTSHFMWTYAMRGWKERGQ